MSFLLKEICVRRFHLQIKINAAALFVILEIHDVEILTSGFELDLPVAKPGPCELATDNPIAGVQPDQFRNDFSIEQIPDAFFVLFTESGLLFFRHGSSLGMDKRGYFRLT